MKEALNESVEFNPILEQIKMYVAQDCTIYKQDLIELCSDKATDTFKPCIILVSVRLGGEELNDIYVSSLKKFLEMDICIGIIGGKPKHSLYFMGYQGDKVIYLDPHFCQPTVNIFSPNDPSFVCNSSPASSLSSSKHSYDDNLSDYEVFENASYHCENPSKTPFSKLDPSLAIGFYCSTLKDVNNLCEYVKKTPSLDNMFPIFGVSEESFEKMHSNFQVLNLDDQQQVYTSPSSGRKPTSTSRSRNVSVTSEGKSSHTKTKSKAGSLLQMKATKSKNSSLSSSSKSKRKQSSAEPDDFVLV